MRRTATRSRTTLIAAAGVAVLATAALGVSAISDSHDASARAAAQVPAAAATVAIAAPAAPAPVASARRVEVAPVVERVAPGTSGMRIQLDAEGQQVPPTAIESDLNYSSVGLTEIQMPDGSVMVDLEGRFQEFEVIVRDPVTGKLSMRCVQDPAKALDARHVHGAVETALPKAER